MKAVISDFAGEDISIEKAILEKAGCQVFFPQTRQQDKLIAAVHDADYLITQFAPINAAVIEAMSGCKLIVRYGIGVDNVDLQAAAARNIPVCNVPDYCIDEVADHTLALALDAVRQITANTESVRAGNWKLAVPVPQMRTLKYLTVGVIGFGRIGREVAARFKAFKCQVQVFDPVIAPEAVSAAGFEAASLERVLSTSDLITLHCPGNSRTKHIINAASIAGMKRGVIIVNSSRGSLVNTADLISALKCGHVSAAALDVTDPEPPAPDSELLKFPSVIVNSHIASVSMEAVRKLREDVAYTVIRLINGEKLINVVNGVNG